MEAICEPLQNTIECREILKCRKALMQTQLRGLEEISNLSSLFSLPVLKYGKKFGKIFFPYIGITLIPIIQSIN